MTTSQIEIDLRKQILIYKTILLTVTSAIKNVLPLVEHNEPVKKILSELVDDIFVFSKKLDNNL